LKENARGDRVVIYANLRYVLLHCVLAITDQLKKAGHEDFGHGFVQPDRTWCIEHSSGGGQPDSVYLRGPLDGESEAVKGGEKLIFRRHWQGEVKTPLELSQKLLHALDIYWVEHRSAYCRLDSNGDIEEVIKIINIETGHEYPGVIVTINSQDIFEFARLANMSLFFYYDFTRTMKGFMGWSGVTHFSTRERDLYYDGGTSPGQGSYINGRQIVRSPISLKSIIKRRQQFRSPKKLKYARFKALCRRSGKVISASCDPDRLTSYFENDPKKPLQITPVFFRGEVLSKYKSDPAKYDLSSRSVGCRGAWGLQTFDVNEQGQVHTYLRYLGQLPYAEQIYWQSFNELPKGGLSKRAIQTDLRGEWNDVDDPVEELKHLARALDAKPPVWWNPRGEDAIRTLHLPITTSEAEWSEAILILDQMLVEGFQIASLRKVLKAANRNFLIDWKSLKLLEECLYEYCVEPDCAKDTIAPLRKLHDLRTIVKGHSTVDKKKAAVKDALSVGSLREHFEQLADGCHKAMKTIVTSFEKLSPASGDMTPT
jgi:hypothetical protein